MMHKVVSAISITALCIVAWIANVALAAAPAAATATAAPAANLGAALGEGWQQLPDWRGVWYLEGPLLFGGPEHAMVPAGAVAAPRVIRKVEFQQGIPAGAYNQRIPYKPEYQKQYDQVVAAALARGSAEDPVENCWTPHGMPRLAGAGPGAVEFHLTPKRSWIIWDYMNQTRRIDTDGRDHPVDDAWPRVMGHSTGKWEGATLVVDTVWMKAGVLDRSGAPHSDELHLVERFARTNADTITVKMTLEDPVMFTGPWKLTRRYKRSLVREENVRGTYCEFGDMQVIKVTP
jgi:hypothetical protein